MSLELEEGFYSDEEDDASYITAFTQPQSVYSQSELTKSLPHYNQVIGKGCDSGIPQWLENLRREC